MRNLLAVFLFIFYGLVSGQRLLNSNYIAEYKLTYKLDSLSDKYRSDHFRLYFNKDESYFLANKTFSRDSLSALKNSDLSKVVKLSTYFMDRVITTTEEVTSIVKYNQDFFGYSFPLDNQWELTNITKTIEGINCKQAKKNYIGRSWTAYYSDAYPFTFGPYKFNGLPGLIVQVEDDQKTYKFTLKGIVKKNRVVNVPNKVKSVKEEDYFKIINENIFSTNVFDTFTIPDNPQEKEHLRRAFEEKVKTFNNFPIERNMHHVFGK